MDFRYSAGRNQHSTSGGRKKTDPVQPVTGGKKKTRDPYPVDGNVAVGMLPGMEPLLTQEMVDPIRSLAVTSRQLYKERIVKGIVSRNMGQHGTVCRG
jgi:hypothetical protein